MAYLEYLLNLITSLIIKLPGILLFFIWIIGLGCIIACSKNTLKTITLPAAVVIILSILMCVAMLYYIFMLCS